MAHTENRFPLFAYERNGKCKLSPTTGKVSTVRLTEGASWSRNKRNIFTEWY